MVADGRSAVGDAEPLLDVGDVRVDEAGEGACFGVGGEVVGVVVPAFAFASAWVG